MMRACSLTQQRAPACLQRRGASTARGRSSRLRVTSRLVLTPTGNGNTDHIGEQIALPGAIELKEGLFEVGRAAPADIVIGVPTISTRHCMLRISDSVVVTDLGSTNGTFVDGKELAPMQAAPLTVGSEVIFGDQYLAAFRLDFFPDEPAAPEPAAAAAEEPAAAPAQE